MHVPPTGPCTAVSKMKPRRVSLANISTLGTSDNGDGDGGDGSGDGDGGLAGQAGKELNFGHDFTQRFPSNSH